MDCCTQRIAETKLGNAAISSSTSVAVFRKHAAIASWLFMEQQSQAVGQKRARTSDVGLFAGMQHSPADGLEQPGSNTEPADVLSFFADRGSRATALQAELDRLQSALQQQAAAFEAAEQQGATLKVIVCFRGTGPLTASVKQPLT